MWFEPLVHWPLHLFRFSVRLSIADTHTCVDFRNQSGRANESSAVRLCVCAPVNNVQSGLLKIYLYMMFMMTATQSMSAHSHTRERQRDGERCWMSERVRGRDPLEKRTQLQAKCAPPPPLPTSQRFLYRCFHSFALLWVIEHTLNRTALTRSLALSLARILLLPRSHHQALSPRLYLSRWQFHSMIRCVLSLILSVLSHSHSLEKNQAKKPNK